MESNKYEKALDILIKLVDTRLTQKGIKEVKESTELLQELVDKATPKKVLDREDRYIPETYEYSHTSGKCPNCKVEVYQNEFNDVVYCPLCGQRLDWSEDEKLKH